MITGGFGIRIHLRPFSVEHYAVRSVDGAPVEAPQFLTPEQAQQDARDKLANADRGLIDTPHSGSTNRRSEQDHG